jgi:pimeloyl-ACP methyl ester carboxylesterase
MHPTSSPARWVFTAVCAAVLALSAQAQNNWPQHGINTPSCQPVIKHSDRTVLGDDIVHYRYTVTVGPGKYDVIRLHRVIKERHPHHPDRTVDGVLMLPGSPNFIESIFMEPLISQVPAWDRSVSVFLAQNGIDVWGMDYGWALVPEETTDFSFMKGWGIAKDSRHAEAALTVARWIRGSTGQGLAPLHLLGFSWGAVLVYPIAAEEARMPPFLRNVKGIIVADVALKYPSGSAEAASACNDLASIQALIDQGVYHAGDGAFLTRIGNLAVSDPEGASADLPGLTNYQAGLYIAAGNMWHFAGGVFGDNGMPVDLRFTEPRLFFDVLKVLPPYTPVITDLAASQCGKTDLPFNDHLAQITVPILYVGARGGFGESGYYTTTLTGSKDITRFTVQLLPDDQRLYDFGHADLFTAAIAETKVWRPILDWLVAHR